ncbi:MAG: 30S ribosomal protein S9 [Candidatus Babeliales bacterium]
MEKTKVKASAKPAAPKAKKTTIKTPKVVPVSHGVGRRKSAVARVWMRPGKGSLQVNGKDFKDYFDTDVTRTDATIPFHVVPVSREFDVQVNVAGGGLYAQAGAIKLGIARALVRYDESLRPLLRQHKLLTVDARRKERKKYGQPAARRKFQFVKR